MPYTYNIEGTQTPDSKQETNDMSKTNSRDLLSTAIAQYAFEKGASAADRPAYNSSPNGMAFQVGLWARERSITIYNVHASRGYVYILNGIYKIKL